MKDVLYQLVHLNCLIKGEKVISERVEQLLLMMIEHNGIISGAYLTCNSSI